VIILEGVIDFVDAFEKDEHYSAMAEKQSKSFQFGISIFGYRALRSAVAS